MAALVQSAAEKLRREVRKEAYRERIEEMRHVFLITENWTPLFKELKQTITRKASYYGRKYHNTRLYQDDFESEFWLSAWELAKEEHNTGDTYFYDRLIKRLDSRAITIVRKAYADKRRPDHFSIRYKAERFDSISTNYRRTATRKKIPLKIEVEQMDNKVVTLSAVKDIRRNPDLTIDESALIKLKLMDPALTLRDLAEQLGLSHPEKVKRMYARIAKKSKEYEGVAV